MIKIIVAKHKSYPNISKLSKFLLKPALSYTAWPPVLYNGKPVFPDRHDVQCWCRCRVEKLRRYFFIVMCFSVFLFFLHCVSDGSLHSNHYSDVIMSAIVSQITGVSIVYLTGCFWCRSKKTSKFCVIGLCEGNSPVTGEFPAQRASNTENVPIWWRHHANQLNQNEVIITQLYSWYVEQISPSLLDLTMFVFL